MLYGTLGYTFWYASRNLLSVQLVQSTVDVWVKVGVLSSFIFAALQRRRLAKAQLWKTTQLVL